MSLAVPFAESNSLSFRELLFTKQGKTTRRKSKDDESYDISLRVPTLKSRFPWLGLALGTTGAGLYGLGSGLANDAQAKLVRDAIKNYDPRAFTDPKNYLPQNQTGLTYYQKMLSPAAQLSPLGVPVGDLLVNLRSSERAMEALGTQAYLLPDLLTREGGGGRAHYRMFSGGPVPAYMHQLKARLSDTKIPQPESMGLAENTNYADWMGRKFEDFAAKTTGGPRTHPFEYTTKYMPHEKQLELMENFHKSLTPTEQAVRIKLEEPGPVYANQTNNYLPKAKLLLDARDRLLQAGATLGGAGLGAAGGHLLYQYLRSPRSEKDDKNDWLGRSAASLAGAGIGGAAGYYLDKLMNKKTAKVYPFRPVNADPDFIAANKEWHDAEKSKLQANRPAADVYIIKGNPGVISANAPEYTKFYNEVANIIRDNGFVPAFDSGEPGTTPPGGKLWIGHSRGADRLRFAPEEVSTLRLDDFEPAETREQQRSAYSQLFKTHGYKNVADVPLSLRPQPGPEHYTLNAEAKAGILKKLQSLQQKLNEKTASSAGRRLHTKLMKDVAAGNLRWHGTSKKTTEDVLNTGTFLPSKWNNVAGDMTFSRHVPVSRYAGDAMLGFDRAHPEYRQRTWNPYFSSKRLLHGDGKDRALVQTDGIAKPLTVLPKSGLIRYAKKTDDPKLNQQLKLQGARLIPAEFFQHFNEKNITGRFLPPRDARRYKLYEVNNLVTRNDALNLLAQYGRKPVEIASQFNKNNSGIWTTAKDWTKRLLSQLFAKRARRAAIKSASRVAVPRFVRSQSLPVNEKMAARLVVPRLPQAYKLPTAVVRGTGNLLAKGYQGAKNVVKQDAALLRQDADFTKNLLRGRVSPPKNYQEFVQTAAGRVGQTPQPVRDTLRAAWNPQLPYLQNVRRWGGRAAVAGTTAAAADAAASGYNTASQLPDQILNKIETATGYYPEDRDVAKQDVRRLLRNSALDLLPTALTGRDPNLAEQFAGRTIRQHASDLLRHSLYPSSWMPRLSLNAGSGAARDTALKGLGYVVGKPKKPNVITTATKQLPWLQNQLRQNPEQRANIFEQFQSLSSQPWRRKIPEWQQRLPQLSGLQEKLPAESDSPQP